MSAAPSAHRATGRRGTGAPTPGRQPAQPHRHATGRGAPPIRSIQWYLRTVHQLRLSVGAIVSAIHRTAQRAQPAVAGMVDRIRASPVVHADETGWRQNGNNGYVCEPLTNHFQHPHRALLPAAGSGQDGGGRGAGRVILRSTGQRLLRRLPPLRWPQATVLGAPAAGHPRPGGSLPQSCPVLDTGNSSSSWPNRTCHRTTTPAERSLRHLVISRKVSGGTRSEQGTESKMTLASIFGTWRAQGLNPLAACRQLLTSPQV